MDARTTRTTTLRVVLLYMAGAVVWIIGSDALLSFRLGQGPEIEAAHVAKGLLFVAVTGALLYRVLARELERRADSERGRAGARAARQRAMILDAMSARVALLDAAGRIVAVNRSWRRFDGRDALAAPNAGVGADYVAACARAAAENVTGAEEIARGLRRVLSGVGRDFEFEYAGSSPRDDRWFRVQVSRPDDAPGGEVLVMHTEVTGDHLARAILEDESRVQSTLARVGREVIATFNGPDLLATLCRVTAEGLGGTICRTYLLDANQDAFFPVASHGAPAGQWEVVRELRLPRSTLSSVIAALDRDGIVQTDPTALLPPTLASAARAARVSTVLLLALRRGDELIGILSVTLPDPAPALTASRRKVALHIAQIASLALQNFRMFEELEGAARLKSEFVATMSHELRTPLNVILGYADMLDDGVFGELDPAQADAIARILRNANQLFGLISDTLDLSRLETGRFALHVEDVVLPDLLREVCDELQDTARTRNLELRCTATDTGAPRISTDRGKLKIVLRNLVVNALKFTDRGGATVGAVEVDGAVEITVSDTGTGIAPDVLPIVFEPFRQGDGSNTRRYGGVGLGLYVVRQLVDRLSGRIAVESEVGKGSTFRVLLPRPVPKVAE